VTDQDDKIRERVRKMLALAEDEGTTQGERDSAFARATQLMARHQIERQMLDDTAPRKEAVGQRDFTFDAPYTRQKCDLLCWTANAMGMRSIVYRRGAEVTRTIIYGFESDLEILDMLYTSLLLQQVSGLRKAAVPEYLSGSSVAMWRRDWQSAFANTVHFRIKSARESEVKTYDREHTGGGGGGAALVLVDRSKAVELRVAELHPNLGKPLKSRSIGHQSARISGQEAGRNADIGGGNRVRNVDRTQIGSR
jgi:hypothetical protein